ncbi:MAG: hypothetical protein ACR2IS_14010 [Nitrososphaeraceae archaeon]
MTLKCVEAIKRSEGRVNSAVKADFPKKHFWILSIWKDQDSLKRFITAGPQATAVKKLKFKEGAGKGSAFVEWTSRRRTIDWTEAMKKLQTLLLLQERMK